MLGSSVRASTNHRRHCFLENPSSLSSLRHISSSKSNGNANQHSFTVSYLVNKCGFSLKSALEASKRVNYETLHKPDSLLSFFKDHGFSENQTLKLTRKCPELLLYNPDKTLLPKLEFLYSKGVSTTDVAKIISFYPWILRCSLENQLVPAFDYLKNWFPNDTIVQILRDNGVPEKNIVMLARSHPKTLLLSPKKFNKVFCKVRTMGLDPCKTQFVIAILALTSMSRSTWEKKLDVYRRWGLSREEILAAFAKSPWFMTLSEEKVVAVMDLFVNKLGWESSFIAKNPTLVSYSLEKRLTPRASVLQFLVSQGLIEKSFRSTTFFIASENKFLQQFINQRAESTQILKLYQEEIESFKIKDHRWKGTVFF
ncbi:hypothetical protein OIU74_017520 [Salix koriyanagi]|uniref:Uncharacterized protein n=1 Tax=Salix koriyanagi TaxID=2511006 RepID=A0A9Q1AH66_9ROSI|nr:hypothetical protein OIU74_017520 [Salix koriyanagi]